MTQHDAHQVNRDSADHPSVAQSVSASSTGMGGDGAAIDPSEENEVWQGHTSWKHFVDLALVALGWSVIALIVAIIASPTVGWVISLLALLGWFYVFGRIVFAVLNCNYRLTTQRLFIERGILSRTIDQAELIRVDDVRIHKSLLNRFCGLGTVEVLSTDVSDREVKIVGVENPEFLADSIRQNMRLLRRKSLFIENL